MDAASHTAPRSSVHVRSAGQGPGVLCLHANASNSGQWRGLMELLAPAYRVLAADLYGAGRSPEWPSPREIALADEVALLAPALEQAGERCVLIGHSYGGAVALKAALAHPRQVRALALYEPTLFALVDAAAPPPNDADGIRHTVTCAGELLDEGDAEAAACCFIDFWSGAGTWSALPEEKRGAMRQSVANIRRWGHALFRDPVVAADLARLDVPVLLMRGTASRRSAHAVADILQETLPRVEVVEFDSVGHMGPLTHAPRVNEAIARFLRELPAA